jgi:hypothetical protein
MNATTIRRAGTAPKHSEAEANVLEERVHSIGLFEG